jgi:uncharacterized membrane protein (DUF4010 family)
VTLALARTAKAGGTSRALAGAAALAAMVSILRVCVIAGLIAPAALVTIAPPALVAAAGFAAMGGLLLLRVDATNAAEAPIRNPFELVPLLIFAALFGVGSTVTAALAGSVGDSGILATSAVTGLFDVDVATLSALRLIGQPVSAELAGKAVLVALAANSVARFGLAMAAGPVGYWAPLAVANLVATGVGVATFLFLPSL